MQNVGYLVWPKIEGRWFSKIIKDDTLAAALTSAAKQHGADSPLELLEESTTYEEAVAKMAKTILAAVERLKARGVISIRVGVSWAEAVHVGGAQWIQWYLKIFSEQGFDILPCINYTPFDLAKARIEKIKIQASTDESLRDLAQKFEEQEKKHKLSTTNIPPEPLSAFGDFVSQFIGWIAKYSLNISWIELWNEPNIDSDWYPDERVASIPMFVDMIAPAAKIAHRSNLHVVMGGLSGVNLEWLRTACTAGLLDHVDAVGLHGLRGTWSDKAVRPSWKDRIDSLKNVMRDTSGKEVPVWLTETGFTAIDLYDEIPEELLQQIQAAVFVEAYEALQNGYTPRVYWYADTDLITPSTRKQTTGWEDILQYFYGDTDLFGDPKLLRVLLENGGPEQVARYVREHNLRHLADTIIDRGDPKSWSMDQLLEVVERKKTKPTKIAV